jgi:cytidylate kinase
MAEKALKIWIKASVDVRVERIVGREGSSFDDKLAETIEREASEAIRYKSIYDINIDDLSVYDLVIDSQKWNQFQITNIVSIAIDNYSDI